MTDEVEQLLMSAALAGDTAEVYAETGTVTTVAFQANRCHALENKLVNGFGLRLIHDGRLGFASATNAERLDDVVAAATETARFGEPARFDLPAGCELPETNIESNRITLLPVSRMLKAGTDVIHLCEQQIPGLKIDLSLQKTATQASLANSQGFEAEYDKTTCALSFEGLLLVDSRFIWFYEFLNLSREFSFDPEEFVRRVARLAEQARKPASLKTGRYPCIFVQSAGAEIINTLSPAVNGKSLEKNMSPLIGKENKKLFDEKLFIWDDGLIDFGFGSAPFDGEGIVQRRTPIIEGGIFRNFLFDLKTAAATGRDSTGNASRSYRSPPGPGATNIVVEPGDLSLEQAIAGIKEGVLIYGTVGGGQSNVLAGDFSVSISLGYKIENGEVTGRVKDAMVAGNIYEIGRRIAGLGDTLYDFGSMQLPFLMFDDLPIATKE